MNESTSHNMKQSTTKTFSSDVIVAITGGIGAGKTFVSEKISSIGIKVYDCDDAAKHIMRSSDEIRQQLCQLIGEDAYTDSILNKSVVARFILKSEANKQSVNAIVHPAVAKDFEKSGLHWLESAILFDSHFNELTHIDFTVCVSAPIETRISRIVIRDAITPEKAKEWIDKQMPQEKMISLSDYVIINDGQHDIDKQIDVLLKKLNMRK